ncbi:MAG: hypothetical protein JWN56_2304 [Sphingobacteriales bacterium]|nr:hypothetical protein [Sphingobacteriales bacterium]
MGLIKFLFITICVLWLLKMIARLLLPMLFQKIVKKAQQQSNQHYQQYNHAKEGEIHVDYIPPQKVKKNPKIDKAGDFVEYEEIK